jgi:regulator of replication initiation timing
MIRALATALLCAAAVIAGDLVFRTSLLRQVRPVILSPADQAIVDAPVQVRWEGPRRMRVLFSIAGEGQQDLGVRESPFELPSEQFPRPGGYQIEIEALRFGSFIRASRWFQFHEAQVPPPHEDHNDAGRDVMDLRHALDAARGARDRAQGRIKFLREENAALRDESERLAKQLEALYKAQEDDADRTAELERRLTQLVEESRALAEENVGLRQRLGAVIPCTVWGYYSYPRPNTIPLSRRALMVSNTRGQIFRVQAECEGLRRADPTAVSICFCVGNSWGG